MSVAELIFGKLRAAKADPDTGSWPRYRELMIEAITNGAENVDPFEVETICEELGKTEADFKQDAETMEKRLGWAEVLKTKGDYKERLTKAEKEIAKVNEEFNRAREKYLAAWGPLEAERKRAISDQWPVESAKVDLKKTCFDPSIALKEQAIEKARKPIGEKIQSLREQLDPNKSRNRGDGVISVAYRLGLLRQEAEHAKKHKEQPRAETLAAIKEAEQQLRNIESRIAELEAESARLNAEHAALNEARLIP